MDIRRHFNDYLPAGATMSESRILMDQGTRRGRSESPSIDGRRWPRDAMIKWESMPKAFRHDLVIFVAALLAWLMFVQSIAWSTADRVLPAIVTVCVIYS